MRGGCLSKTYKKNPHCEHSNPAKILHVRPERGVDAWWKLKRLESLEVLDISHTTTSDLCARNSRSIDQILRNFSMSTSIFTSQQPPNTKSKEKDGKHSLILRVPRIHGLQLTQIEAKIARKLNFELATTSTYSEAISSKTAFANSVKDSDVQLHVLMMYPMCHRINMVLRIINYFKPKTSIPRRPNDFFRLWINAQWECSMKETSEEQCLLCES